MYDGQQYVSNARPDYECGGIMLIDAGAAIDMPFILQKLIQENFFVVLVWAEKLLQIPMTNVLQLHGLKADAQPNIKKVSENIENELI